MVEGGTVLKVEWIFGCVIFLATGGGKGFYGKGC
jgi:hypothetical protein